MLDLHSLQKLPNLAVLFKSLCRRETLVLLYIFPRMEEYEFVFCGFVIGGGGVIYPPSSLDASFRHIMFEILLISVERLSEVFLLAGVDEVANDTDDVIACSRDRQIVLGCVDVDEIFNGKVVL